MKKIYFKYLSFVTVLMLLFIQCGIEIFDDEYDSSNPSGKNFVFAKRIEVSGSPVKILKLSNGDYITAGNYNNERYQGFLLCVNKDLNYKWEVSVDLAIKDMVITDNDEIYLAGSSYGNSSNSFKFKPKVTKHQSDGTLIWGRMLQLEKTAIGKINKMIITSDGGLLFGGYKNAGGQSLYTVGFVAKTDMELNLNNVPPDSWNIIIDGQYFAGDNDETLSLLEINQNGTPEYIITGLTTLGSFIANGNDLWIMRFNQYGIKQKSIIFTVPDNIVGKINDLAEFNNEIVGVGTWASVDSNNFGIKCWILNFDKATLNIDWNYQKGNNHSLLSVIDLITTKNNNYLILGSNSLMKWYETEGGKDDLIWERGYNPQYSTLTFLFLKSVISIPENRGFIMVGIEEEYDDGLTPIGSNLIFIRTDLEGNCEGCF